MKWINFLIFFSIVLVIYSAINFYIYKRLANIIPADHSYRSFILILFFFIVSCFIVGRILERFYLSIISDTLIWIGSFWLAFMLYFFLIILFIDILRAANHFMGIFPSFITRDYLKAARTTGLIVVTVVTLVVIAGFINSRIITLKHLTLKIDKKVEGLSELNIVMFSDLHLGTIIGKRFAKKVVDLVNDQNADIILIPGDIIDEDIAPVLKDGICEEMNRLKSKYGVYAVTGNHEYIGNAEIAVSYLTKNGINVLRDSSLLVDNKFYLVGREDRSRRQFAGWERKSLDALMTSVDTTKPVILMDHQPFNLDQAVKNGADLQLSGHTHHGQLFPINFITNMIYELSWGYLQKGDTHFFVSCGIGGWGPPVRLGSRPEIVSIKLNFSN